MLGLLVATLVTWEALGWAAPREYEVPSATVTKLDLAKRTAEIEFVHPKNGRMIAVAGSIPRDCTIYIDDKLAQLDDVRVGDSVAVRGMIYADHTVRPNWVRVKRGLAATQPASPAAPADPP